MKIGRRFKGTPLWGDIKRENSAFIGQTHSQVVCFSYGNKRYEAHFARWFNRNAAKGERITYTLDIIRIATGRDCPTFAASMLEQTQWLSTFKRNVEEYAAKL